MNPKDLLREKLEGIYEEYPEFIARKVFAESIDRSNRTLANLDSRGIGIPGAIKINRLVYYPKIECINWLLKNMEEKL